jgi:hypothetical protein
VDDERLLNPLREFDLLFKALELFIDRRPVAIKIETGLSDRDDPRVSSALLENIKVYLIRRVVWMHASARPYTRMLFRERDSATRSLKPLARADGQHSSNSRGSGAPHNGPSILIKFLRVEVGVGVGDIHRD